MSDYENVKVEGGEAVSAMPTPGVKRGHMCCGGCCDVRRAAIIVNIIMLCIMALGTLTIAAGLIMIKTVAEDADDDDVKQAATQLDGLPVGLPVVIMLIQMAGSACGIFGALNYNANLVMVAFVFHCIYTIFALARPNTIPDVILGAFFAYPHWFLYKEIKDGTMSPESYVNERASCCCV
mmetsp:Transcript_27838/g.78004  ORF Transcript_27838/g.78004 Transcript_27838/m.78004 type:complete len:180 (-) Transcript_27838:194-733(-)